MNIAFINRWALVSLAMLLAAIALGLILYDARYTNSTKPSDMRDASEIEIVLTENGFSPREVILRRGTRITFSTTRNAPFWPASNSHPVHELYPEFDPDRQIEPDEKWSFVVDKPGTWGFHDHIRAYYRGTLYVE